MLLLSIAIRKRAAVSTRRDNSADYSEMAVVLHPRSARRWDSGRGRLGRPAGDPGLPWAAVAERCAFPRQMVLENLSPVVVFRYNNEAVKDGVYLDNLNSWVSSALVSCRGQPNDRVKIAVFDKNGFHK